MYSIISLFSTCSQSAYRKKHRLKSINPSARYPRSALSNLLPVRKPLPLPCLSFLGKEPPRQIPDYQPTVSLSTVTWQKAQYSILSMKNEKRPGWHKYHNAVCPPHPQTQTKFSQPHIQ